MNKNYKYIKRVIEKLYSVIELRNEKEKKKLIRKKDSLSSNQTGKTKKKTWAV